MTVLTLTLGAHLGLSKEKQEVHPLRHAFQLKVIERNCQERKEAGEWFEKLGVEDAKTEALSSEDCLPVAKARYQAFLKQSQSQDPSKFWSDLGSPKANLSKHFSYSEITQLFTDGKKFSVSEWKVFQEWFGDSFTQRFQEELFPSVKNESILKAQVENKNILWILDPYRKILSTENSLDPEQIRAKIKNLEIVELSPYGNSDSQAEELKNILQIRLKKKHTLISSGRASAILLKTLDLHPSLLSNPNIESWLNLDGQLYGSKPQKSRAPASAVDNFQERILVGVRMQYLDSLDRNPPLGKGFPVFNVLLPRKQKEILREKIIPEETNVEISNWKSFERMLQGN